MIDQKKFEISQDLEVENDKIIHFARDQLIKFQPREDYKELLKIFVMFLKGILDQGISKTWSDSLSKIDG